MKLKEFGPPGGHASLAPPLDPPLTDVCLSIGGMRGRECDRGAYMMVGVSVAGETATGFLDVYKTLGKMGS